MNTFDTIFSRKSIRNYTGEDISDKELDMILKAAYAAPIGRARYDTLCLTVIKNKDFLSELDRESAAAFGDPGKHPLYGAPTLILISSVVNPAPQDNVNYSNAAIVAENIALAAAELGVGACLIWGAVRVLNVTPNLLKKLSLPADMIPCCAVALGKTDEKYTLREPENERIKTVYMN